MVFEIHTKAMNFSLNFFPKAYVEIKVGGKSIAYLNWIFAKLNICITRINKSYKLIKMRMCVVYLVEVVLLWEVSLL
jgi:hypothetical protein